MKEAKCKITYIMLECECRIKSKTWYSSKQLVIGFFLKSSTVLNYLDYLIIMISLYYVIKSIQFGLFYLYIYRYIYYIYIIHKY